jgi:hypothetical protein
VPSTLATSYEIANRLASAAAHSPYHEADPPGNETLDAGTREGTFYRCACSSRSIIPHSGIRSIVPLTRNSSKTLVTFAPCDLHPKPSTNQTNLAQANLLVSRTVCAWPYTLFPLPHASRLAPCRTDRPGPPPPCTEPPARDRRVCEARCIRSRRFTPRPPGMPPGLSTTTRHEGRTPPILSILRLCSLAE